jgi:uncharacterized protein
MSVIEIYIDADATPRDALRTAERLAEEFGAMLTTVSSMNHQVKSSRHISVDAHPQAVDMKIVSLVSSQEKCVVVTQDYGLAALVLGSGGAALSPRGMEYTEANIDRLLFERALHARERRATGRSKGPKARTDEDAVRFEQALRAILERLQTTSFSRD